MTLKQIAEQAGVSVASVSNVINGNFHKVSAETRRKIEAIIEENNYRPNALARSLVTQESRIVMLVIPHVAPEETFESNPYYSELVSQVERLLRGRGYCLMLQCAEHCADILPTLSSWNVDGALFVGVWKEEIQEIQNSLGCPAVFLDSYGGGSDVTAVLSDDYRGGYLAARHLLNLGHRKIAFAGPVIGESGVIYERFCGFRDALSEYGIEIQDKDIFRADSVKNKGVVAGQDIALSKGGYTAVCVMSDVTAFGIIEGLRQCGLRVPEDVSVMGYDNLRLSAFSTPKLTTISQDLPFKVRTAGELLFERIRNKESPPVCEKLPVKLVERESARAVRGEENDKRV